MCIRFGGRYTEQCSELVTVYNDNNNNNNQRALGRDYTSTILSFSVSSRCADPNRTLTLSYPLASAAGHRIGT